MAAYVDEIIEFSRLDDNYPNRRQIKSYGRSSSELPTIAIEFTSEEKYVLLGDAWKVSSQARLDRVVEIIGKNDKATSMREILNKWGEPVNRRTISRYIGKLLKSNTIRFVKEEIVDKKRQPFYEVNKEQEEFREIVDIFSK